VARTKSIKLKQSKKELNKIIGMTQRLAKALTVAMRAVKKEEIQANKLSSRKMRGLAVHIVKKARKLRGSRLGARKGLTGKKALKLVLKSGGKSRKVWTAGQVAKMRQMLVSGMKVRDVALALRRKVGAVRQRLFLEGISMKAIKKAAGSKKPGSPKVTTFKGKKGAKIDGRTKAGRKQGRKVLGRAAKTKIVTTWRAWTPNQVASMKKMLTAGVTMNVVAGKLGRNIAAVRQRLSQEKFSLRAIKKTAAKVGGHPTPASTENKPVAKPDVTKDAFFVPPPVSKEN